MKDSQTYSDLENADKNKSKLKNGTIEQNLEVMSLQRKLRSPQNELSVYLNAYFHKHSCLYIYIILLIFTSVTLIIAIIFQLSKGPSIVVVILEVILTVILLLEMSCKIIAKVAV